MAALIGKKSKFPKFFTIILSLLTWFLPENTLAQTHYSNNKDNKSLSLLDRILEGIPNYCGVRLIFQTLNSEQVQPSLLTLTSVISLFRFENKVTVHNGRLNESYKKYYDSYSRYVNCTLNLILPPQEKAFPPEINSSKDTLTFLNDSIRLLISEPVHWNFKELRYIKSTSNHFNLILFQDKLSKTPSIKNTPTLLLYSSSFLHSPFYLNNFGLAFLPDQEHLPQSIINICIQNQGTTPSLSNMNCLHVNQFSLTYLHSLAKPPKNWVSFANNAVFHSEVDEEEHQTRNRRNRNNLNVNYEAHLLSVIMQHTNTTWVSEYSPTTTGQRVFAGGLDIVSTLHFVNSNHVSLTSTDSMRFLTCYSRPILSFKLYVDSFEISTWIGISSSVLIIAILIHFMLKIHRTKKNTFSPAFYLLRMLLDQADDGSVPNVLKMSQGFRLTIGLWLLSLVLLSNIYLSKVIAQLNSPVRSGKLDYYKDIVCPWSDADSAREFHVVLDELLSFWTNPSSISGYIKNTTNSREKDCFSLLSGPMKPFSSWKIEESGQEDPSNYVFPYRLLKLSGDVLVRIWRKEVADRLQNKTSQPDDHTIMRKIFSSWHPVHRFYPRNLPAAAALQYKDVFTESLIENEIVQCRKSAFIGDESSVSAEFDYLRTNYDRVPFQTGSVDHLGRLAGWAFEHPGNSPMPGILARFVETGILEHFSRNARYNKYLKRKQGTQEILRDVVESRVKPLDLEGSIQTIFILWAALLTSGIAIWLSEIFMRSLRFRLNSDPVFGFLN
jgi:uncharacterized membrane protein